MSFLILIERSYKVTFYLIKIGSSLSNIFTRFRKRADTSGGNAATISWQTMTAWSASRSLAVHFRHDGA